MIGKLLMRGLLAGAIAALLSFAVARVIGEPVLDRAIAIEESGDTSAAGGHAHAPAPAASEHDHGQAGHVHAAEPAGGISRATQAGIGLLSGLVVYGTAMGGLFALAFAFAYGRLGMLGVRGTSLLLAGLAFVAVVVVPFLKYPANPPGASQGETIVDRTQFYMILLALSVGAAILSVWLQRLLTRTMGGWGAGLLSAGAFALVVAVAFRALPGIDEVPQEFPASLLWEFRVAALGMQAALWGGIGLLFGYLADRAMASGGEHAARPVSRPA